jgi:predicted nucleotidyltransferase
MNTENILASLRMCKLDLTNLGIRNVGLFGSFVRNEATESSDIDVLIDFDPNAENFDNFMAVFDILERQFPGKHLDIVTMNGMSPYIGPSILAEVKYA